MSACVTFIAPKGLFVRRLGGLASGKATLGDKSIRFGRGFCMVAMWRMERIGTGRAIKAAASQKGQSDGRILEESMYASAAANGAATATVTAAATDDEYGGASSRWAH